MSGFSLLFLIELLDRLDGLLLWPEPFGFLPIARRTWGSEGEGRSRM